MNLTRRPVYQKADKVGKDPAHLARVRTLPCAIGHNFDEPCQGPIAAHHVFHDRFGTTKVPDRQTIPLCWGHHQGPQGIHANKAAWREKYGPDHHYIAWTLDMLDRWQPVGTVAVRMVEDML